MVPFIEQLFCEFLRGRLADRGFLAAGSIDGHVMSCTAGDHLLCIVSLIVAVTDAFIDALINSDGT